MVFYFLVGNVFFLSLLSGSLLTQIGESFAHPKDFPSHLASAVSAQVSFKALGTAIFIELGYYVNLHLFVFCHISPFYDSYGPYKPLLYVKSAT